MLCSKCKKRPASVVITLDKEKSQSYGLCTNCLKEFSSNSLKDLVKGVNTPNEDFNDVLEHLSNIFSSEIDKNPEDVSVDLDSNNPMPEAGFIYGGSATLPFFKNILSSFLPSMKAKDVEKDDQKNSDTAKSSDKTNSEVNKKSNQGGGFFRNFMRGNNSKRRYIDIYCENLNKKAIDKKLDIIVGRDREISRVIQILSRRTKNNPCLIGEPGVGKTAIAEGLAIKIVNGQVPEKLKNKEVHLLDLTALVAGTQFRGQFEHRIKGLIEEVKKDGNIIMFIDEVHSLVGAGNSEGSMNAANILKPALSRGEVQVIGATTFTEYRKYIEKDSALERRFQPVKVEEPSVNDTIEILKGIRPYYENHHRVKVTDFLLRKMVLLSERYITDRFLPDKAIDLLDESCAYASLKNKNLVKYDEMASEIEKLKGEEEKLVSDSQKADYEWLADVRTKLAKLIEQQEKITPLALNQEVLESDLAHVIELWTGISSAKVQENEFKRLEDLEDRLKEKIIGQDVAVKEVALAIRRSKIQINPKRRPASFIFVGSTGVGKTELVKVLSEELFDNPDSLIRLDMSEYMEKHSVSKLIGSPPGYVGYDEAGQITEKVRQKPYSILLFDEIEKAHPDIMNLLLQILDDGKLTDSHGRVVNFENTVIVMTSNAGSDKKVETLGFAKSEHELTKEKAIKSLSEFLRPEFLARVDEIIVFNKLTQDNLKDICKLMLDEYVKSLAEHNIIFDYEYSALERLSDMAKDKKNGARELRNLIRKEVEDKISLKIIEKGDYNIGKIVLDGTLNIK